MSNLKQIGVAALMYADSWDGWLPVEDSNSGNIIWNGAYIYYGKLIDSGILPKSATVLYCPSQRDRYTIDDPTTGAQNIGVPGNTVRIQYQQRGSTHGAPRRLEAETKALVADIYATALKNHQDGVNALFSDGSVRFFTVDSGFSVTDSNSWAELDNR